MIEIKYMLFLLIWNGPVDSTLPVWSEMPQMTQEDCFTSGAAWAEQQRVQNPDALKVDFLCLTKDDRRIPDEDEKQFAPEPFRSR